MPKTPPSVEQLSNGVTLVNAPIEGATMASIHLIVRAGSRDETRDTAGLAHFREHLFFKGSAKYPTYRDINTALAELGAEVNAWTDVEDVAYWISLPARNLDRGLEILADMLVNPRFDAAEMEKERNVVIQELARTSMNADEWLGDRSMAAAFGGDQPMAWSAGGSPDVIRRVTRDDIVAYGRELYHPERIAVVVAGGATVTRARAEELFGALRAAAPPRPRVPARWGMGPQVTERVVALQPGDEPQTQLSLLLPGLPSTDPDIPALQVMSMILGGDMWSRLFTTVREEQGLVYGINAGHVSYDDAGRFDIDMATRPGDAAKATTTALRVLQELAATGPTEQEMRMARAVLGAGTLSSLESARRYGMATALRWRRGLEPLTPEQLVERMDRVSAADVQRVARRIAAGIARVRIIDVSPVPVGQRVRAAIQRQHLGVGGDARGVA